MNTASASAPKKASFPFRTFFGLLILFAVLRLLPVFTAVERVSHYDELDLGVIAKDWLEGPSLPFWHYQIDPYGGESIILGALAMPFVKLIGPTLLAVKIPSLLFSLASFYFLTLFLWKFFGRSPALTGALLLICCPPALIQFSSAGLSGHAEALTFSVASLYFFYQAIFGSERKMSFFLFGLTAGFGFWFYHLNLVMTAACLLSWLILDKKYFFSKFFILFLFGSAAGLLPWFSYLNYYRPTAFSFAAESLSQFTENLMNPDYCFRKLAKLLVVHLPESFSFFPVLGMNEKLYSRLLFWAGYVPILFVAVRKMSRKMIPLAVFAVLYLCLFAISHYSIAPEIGYIGYRYLTPLHFFIIPFICSWICNKRVWLVFILVIGLAGQTSLIFKEPFASAQNYLGYSYYRVGTQWYHTLSPAVTNSSELVSELSKRPSVDAYYLLWGIASVDLASKNPRFGDLYPPAWTNIPLLTPSAQMALEPLQLMWDSNMLFHPSIKRMADNLPEGSHAEFYKGLGWAVRAIHREDDIRTSDWISLFPQEMIPFGLQGAKDFDQYYDVPITQ